MASLNLDYYYGNESEQFTFFRIPKVLFTDDRFKKLSAESKVLYGMLLDRMGLSRANGWLDKANRVYIVFTIEDIQSNLCCGRQKAVKLMAELDSENGIGLIEKKRQGLGKPNIIYVKNFIIENAQTLAITEEGQKYENQTSGGMKIKFQEVSESNFKKYENQTSESMKIKTQEVPKSDFKDYENQTSGSVKNELQEVSKSNCNNTNLNNTDINHIKSYPISNDGQDGINQITDYEKVIKDNIDYRIAYSTDHMVCKDVDNMISIMCDVLCMPEDATIKVNGVSLPVSIVKQRFLEIRQGHIDYILDSLRDNPSDIKNIRAYLVTTIFNAPATISQYYRSKVNHDLYGAR